MPNNVWTVEIAAKPEDVWPYVGTLERHADWSAGPFTVEWLSGEPNAPGSRFRSIGKLPLIGKDYPMEGEVLESEPPWRFVTSSSDKTGAYRNTITLEPRGQGILVTRVVDARSPRVRWLC